MDESEFLLLLCVVAFAMFVFGVIGIFVGQHYHGRPILGFIVGSLLGIIGILLMIFFPDKGYPVASAAVSKCRFCMSVLNPGASVCHRCGRDQAIATS